MDRKNRKKKVVVAMSGGVDSSVSAALLKEAGFNALGVFMKFWNPKTSKKGNRCCSLESEKRARMVCKKLNIPFYVLNFEKEFKKEVVDYFLREYKEGRTPNPCVVCNYEIKFGLLIEKTLALGADFIATGHYSRIKNNNLLKGVDKEKDQSYFLWKLNQNQLSKILFPVGGYTKLQVRNLAKDFALPTSETPESQEVCFVESDTSTFLRKYLKTKPGKILDVSGSALGRHDGLWFYTIGQRKGIKLSGGPYYVVDKDYTKNSLIVSKKEKDLLRKEFIVKNANWILGKNQKFPLKAMAKIRYRQDSQLAVISKVKNNKLKVVFNKLEKAVASGQSAVFYTGEKLLGGGIIE